MKEQNWDEALDELYIDLKRSIYEYNKVVLDDPSNKKDGFQKFEKFCSDFEKSLQDQKRQRQKRDFYKNRDIDIKTDYENGFSINQLAKKYKVSRTIIKITLALPDVRPSGKGKHRR